MNELRLLTEGLGGWLHYEFCCNRSELFSEKYLAPPIGNILSSTQPDRVHAEFTHQILSSSMSGRGRRPAIDFVISKKYPHPDVAIESKWIGKSAISPADLLRDLVRLSLLSHYFDTRCYFILAGRKRSLDDFFLRAEFTGPGGAGSKPILRTNSNHQHSISLTPNPAYRIPVLKKCFSKFKDIQVPQKVITRRTDPFPSNAKTIGYQVHAWEVFVPPSKPLFWPKRSKHLK